VIVTRNNYEKGVFNGDMGTISQIYAEEQTILLKPSASGIGDEVVYEFDEMDELALGYAVTVHRSQGSEFPAVIMPVSTQHYVMLQRNLLYTGLTRAKRLAVLVGTKKALGIAVNQAQVAERYTWLRQRLQEVE
jgi:exodeoxyribonuclease V alpha subunit